MIIKRIKKIFYEQVLLIITSHPNIYPKSCNLSKSSPSISLIVQKLLRKKIPDITLLLPRTFDTLESIELRIVVTIKIGFSIDAIPFNDVSKKKKKNDHIEKMQTRGSDTSEQIKLVR